MTKYRASFAISLRAPRLLRMLALCAAGGTLALSLSGCVGLALGGAVVGTMAATDRRTFGAQTEDKTIELKSTTRINNMPGGAGHVDVTSYNRKVLLTGEVPDEATKAEVERQVMDVEGVQSIVNELAIAGASSMTSRSNDALLTGKVKASLVDARDISANSFKVSTERGTVYLMGRVTQREGSRAAEVARGIAGVQKVVKVFEYIDESEARQMSGSAAPQGTTR
jgi:osmotically-inducible protein OsmY